jgi:hypothetical protein
MRLAIVDPGERQRHPGQGHRVPRRHQSCSANPSTGVRGRAQVIGSLFNDGTSPGAGDRTGDIFAGLQQILDTVLGAVFQPFLLRCTNASCSTFVAVDPSAPLSFVTTFHQWRSRWVIMGGRGGRLFQSILRADAGQTRTQTH